MKGLTVQQPWAWAIIHGGKDIENRTQAWSYRGPLAIHAGKRLSDRGMNDDRVTSLVGPAGSVTSTRKPPEGFPPHIVRQAPDGATWAARLDIGAIIGVVDLVDVHPAMRGRCYWGTTPGRPACCDSEWGELEYREHGGKVRTQIVHLVLENPRPLTTPVPATGRLGLWNLDGDLLDQVQEALL